MFSIVRLCRTCSPLSVINIPPSPGPAPLGGVSASLGGIALPEKKNNNKKKRPKPSSATWNYRMFKAGTSCPSEIHSAYHKAKPAQQDDAGRDVFLLSTSDRLFMGPRQAPPIV